MHVRHGRCLERALQFGCSCRFRGRWLDSPLRAFARKQLRLGAQRQAEVFAEVHSAERKHAGRAASDLEQQCDVQNQS